MAPAQHAPVPGKKAKPKKSADPSEQQKQIQAKIAQLEQDAAGDKEQELEIGALTPLHGRSSKSRDEVGLSLGPGAGVLSLDYRILGDNKASPLNALQAHVETTCQARFQASAMVRPRLRACFNQNIPMGHIL